MNAYPNLGEQEIADMISEMESTIIAIAGQFAEVSADLLRLLNYDELESYFQLTYINHDLSFNVRPRHFLLARIQEYNIEKFNNQIVNDSDPVALEFLLMMLDDCYPICLSEGAR